METTADQILLRLFEPLTIGDEMEILPVQGAPIPIKVEQLFSIVGESLNSVQKDRIVGIPKPILSPISTPIQKLNVARILRKIPPVKTAISQSVKG